MDDLISRQAAMDALNEKCLMPVWCKVLVKKMLTDLPSAQPVCTGCRYDWLGDPRCAKCARSFQDHYEAERKEK